VPDSRAIARAQRRLEALPGVGRVRVESVCCESGKEILYVGIGESAAASLKFRAAPKGKIRLPPDILKADADFQKAFEQAIRAGDTGDDFSHGHSLMNNPAARAVQERFVGLAARYENILRDVLRNSSDSKQRALAAQVLAYSANKQSVVEDLVEAMRDPADGVRNNATRALWVMAAYSQRSPENSIRIPYDPFVDMLNSVEWTDRNKSSAALMELTAGRDPALLSLLGKRALASLVEMARWKSQGHAQPAFFILGRIGGFSDDELWRAWSRGDREPIIRATLERIKAN